MPMLNEDAAATYVQNGRSRRFVDGFQLKPCHTFRGILRTCRRTVFNAAISSSRCREPLNILFPWQEGHGLTPRGTVKDEGLEQFNGSGQVAIAQLEDFCSQ